MRHNGYNPFFPTPRFLSMAAVGLDISDRSIKYAELIPRRRGFQVGRFGTQEIPAGVIQAGVIQDTEKFAEVLTSLRQELKLQFVRVSLPEEEAYLFRTRVPKLSGAELRSAIELQLEKYVPLSIAEIIFDYQITNETNKSYDLLVTAISQTVVQDYLQPMKKAGLKPVSFELEAQAIARCVIPREDKDTKLVVDFGATRTGIFIVVGGIVHYAVTVEIGGNLLNTTISKGLKISVEEAEKLKIQHGLLEAKETAKVLPQVLEHITKLAGEVDRNVSYWHSHPDEMGKERAKIAEIIFCGGNAALPGLLDIIKRESTSKLPATVTNAWTNVVDLNTAEYIPKISQEDSLSYVAALGLALGDYHHD